jgi:hypothetical protein
LGRKCHECFRGTKRMFSTLASCNSFTKAMQGIFPLLLCYFVLLLFVLLNGIIESPTYMFLEGFPFNLFWYIYNTDFKGLRPGCLVSGVLNEAVGWSSGSPLSSLKRLVCSFGMCLLSSPHPFLVLVTRQPINLCCASNKKDQKQYWFVKSNQALLAHCKLTIWENRPKGSHPTKNGI